MLSFSSILHEKEALEARSGMDAEQRAAVQAELRIYTGQLEQIQTQLQTLEGSQTDADQRVSNLTDTMNTIRTEKAALDAERTTAMGHIADLRVLRAAAEGDRDKKLADIDSIQAEINVLEEEIKNQQTHRKTMRNRSIP